MGRDEFERIFDKTDSPHHQKIGDKEAARATIMPYLYAVRRESSRLPSEAMLSCFGGEHAARYKSR